MKKDLSHLLAKELEKLKESGLYKKERVITSPQQAEIKIQGGQEVINLCANNYLGLANNRTLIQTAQKTLDDHGFGLSSVRFICGTQDIHKELEKRLSQFLKMEDTILYSSCFDANGGLFETLFTAEDAIISDELNHASIIDGIRLCKAGRFRYRNNDMADLEAKLQEAKTSRFRLIVTDGVFSMDGIIADLKRICDLSDQYDALVMVDDSHAVGFIGEHGRGTHEYCGVMDRIDIITGTLGKALGGASGGYTSGNKKIIEWLRQRSRPYLFSNTVAPVIVGTSLKVLDFLESGSNLRKKLMDNTQYFRSRMEKSGFTLIPGHHPIIPVMIGDAKLSSLLADRLLHEGIYVISFSYPVVPEGKARIRTQISAAHEKEHLDRACEAFVKAGRELKII
ncbi:MAG TPA: glycine C-acetyltransferase [Rhabdochlamydiaceae bacterium]|nr:glycine C-acetyltransferase [Rhabdochlamydiaceae bacterium]